MMDENTQNIIEVIDESFLRDEEKRIFAEQLAQEGPSDAFFAAMNISLISELKKRGNLYEEVIDNFETSYDGLENEYKNKKKELDDGLDDNISKADLVNLAGKENIFDQYYKDIDSVQADYEKGVKELYSSLSSSIMEE